MTPMDQSRFNQQYGIYTKLQDKLMYLGRNAILNMNTMLYSDSEKYGRRYYYKEIQYASEKAGCEVKKIVRDFDAYLSIENIKPVNGVKEFITIRARDLELMRYFLIPKFEDIIKNFNKIYEMRDKKMYVNKITPFEVDVGPGGRKPLIFVPGIHKTYTEDLEPCIDMYINGNHDNIASLSFNQVYEFMYLIRTFQIHLYASTMLSYMGRPPVGTNLINMSDGMIYSSVEELNRGSTSKRFIGGAKDNAYFNKKGGE